MSPRAPHAPDASPRRLWRRLALLGLVGLSAGASACFMAGYDLLAVSDSGMDGAPPDQTQPEPEAGSSGDPDAGDVMSSVDAGAVDGGAAEDADVADAKAMPDAAPMDGGGMDASDAMPDARVDASDASPDARMPEASAPDATPPDAMPPDAASDGGPDAMPTDAGEPCVIDAGCIEDRQTCGAGAYCSYLCDAGAHCTFNCKDSMRCDVTCQPGSRCEVSSRTTSVPDTVICQGNAECIRQCGTAPSNVTNCGFASCGHGGNGVTCTSDVRCGWGCP